MRAPKRPTNVISAVLLCSIIASERPIFQNEKQLQMHLDKTWINLSEENR